MRVFPAGVCNIQVAVPAGTREASSVIIVADKRLCQHRGAYAYHTDCKACRWQLDLHEKSWNEFAGNAKPGDKFNVSEWEYCVRHDSPFKEPA